jgi:hypothetical protein
MFDEEERRLAAPALPGCPSRDPHERVVEALR